MANKRQALGKGLNALLTSNDNSERQYAEDLIENLGAAKTVKLEHITANPYQPRKEFNEDALAELSESITMLGIIQPVTLRQMNDGKYQIISGERRIRAAKMAGLTKIPAYTREANDQEMLEMALVENIQRQDLNALEIALSYQRLMEECKLTQEALGERVAKKRSTITNYLRLLKLPAEIQSGIKTYKITMGHARCLINAGNKDIQVSIYNQILDKGLSVRQVEMMVRAMSANAIEKDKESATKSPKYVSYPWKNNLITQKTNCTVNIHKTKTGKGSIHIDFKNEKELDNIIAFFEKLR